MRSRRSTWSSRLALALLALVGFAGPVVAVEADRVVQTTGAKAAPAVVAPVVASVGPVAAEGEPAPVAVFVERERESSRRYLLFESWLI